MNLLTRDEIIQHLESNKDIINDGAEGYFQKNIGESYSKDSTIQQCSVELHIGKIYLPEVNSSQEGSTERPITTEYVLETGQTALVRTLERVELPGNIAGICFSPSRITLKGLLITNMGHVDPGYEGCLHFTIINMGGAPYVLRIKDVICTMLLIELKQITDPYGPEEFEDENNEIPTSVTRNLPRLSKDFVKVEQRSKDIAKAQVTKAKLWSIAIPIIVAFIITVPGLFHHFVSKPWEKQIASMQKKIDQIDYSLKIEEKIKGINVIETRLDSLKVEERINSIDQIETRLSNIEKSIDTLHADKK